MIIIRRLFLEFILFSVLGYIVECVYSSVIEKKINFNRGFFMGPYCPIYGFTLLMINFFNHLSDCFLLMFSFVIIFFIEYFTSYVLEKIFNKNWWDYSRKRYNINGRVCLENLVIFSVSSFIIIRKVIPFLDNILSIDSYYLIIVTFVLFIIFSVDLSFSLKKHHENSTF